jgi:hypothetical protein
VNLTAIRTRIASQLAETPNLTASPRIPKLAEVTCPHAFISDMGLRIVSMTESVDIEFEVTVLVSPADADSGWETISELCDVGAGTSVIDSLLSDRTLETEISSLTFGEIRGLGGTFDVGGAVFLGFQMAFTAHV